MAEYIKDPYYNTPEFLAVREITGHVRMAGTHGCKLTEIIPGVFTAHFNDIKDPHSFEALNLQPPIGLVINSAVAAKQCDTYPGYYGSDIDVLCIDLLDDPTPGDAKKDFAVCNEKIKKVLDEGKSVLIHCMASISRSAVFVLAFLMEYKGWTVVEAAKHMKSKWDATWPNHLFVRQLLEFEAELKASGKINQ